MPQVGLIWLHCCYLNGGDEPGVISSVTLQMPEDRQPCAGLSWEAASSQRAPGTHRVPPECDPGTEPHVWQPSWPLLGDTRLLDVLSTEMPGPGNCCCHAAQPGWSAQVTTSSWHLWSFENRVFKERGGPGGASGFVLCCFVAGINDGVLKQCCVEHPRSAVNPQYLWRAACSTAIPASQGGAHGFPQCQNLLQHPGPHRSLP